MSQTHWSLGVLIGLPIWLVVILALLAFAAFAWKEDEGGMALGTVGVVILCLLIIGGGYFPWKAEYHQWRPVSGTVTDVSNRIMGSNGDINQRFVVTFDNGLTRSCDDTRCSLVKAGDRLTLTCKKHWQFAGTSGYDCNFVSRRGGAA